MSAGLVPEFQGAKEAKRKRKRRRTGGSRDDPTGPDPTHLTNINSAMPPTVLLPSIAPQTPEVEPARVPLVLHLVSAGIGRPVRESDDVVARIPDGAVVVRHVDELEHVEDLGSVSGVGWPEAERGIRMREMSKGGWGQGPVLREKGEGPAIGLGTGNGQRVDEGLNKGQTQTPRTSA